MCVGKRKDKGFFSLCALARHRGGGEIRREGLTYRAVEPVRKGGLEWRAFLLPMLGVI